MLPVQSCFCTADYVPRFKSITFYHNKPKIKLKERKIFERWGSALRHPKSPPLHICNLAPVYGSETWCLRERDGNFEKNRKSDDWCEGIRSMKQGGVDGHFRRSRVFG